MCGATSTTLPCSRTRIWSHSISDDSRCETMIIVRPLAMRRRLALTTASLSGSSALVASSRIRMRGSWISARAIASRWLLAARQVGRAFLDIGLVAVRHALDEFLGAGKARGAHSHLPASGPAVRR